MQIYIQPKSETTNPIQRKDFMEKKNKQNKI
jgi:hypothetical protein